jgi:hypothetical protein
MVTDPITIRQWCEAKQRNEQELSQRLYKQFNSDIASQKVRQVVQLAVQAMVADPFNPAFIAAINEEPFLDVWKKATPPGASVWAFQDILRKIADPAYHHHFELSDLSDLIRLVGAWVEKGGMGGSIGLAPIKEAFRPGVLPTQPETGPPGWATERWTREVAGVWGPGRRDRGNPWDIEAHIQPVWRQGGVAGLKLKRAQGNSNVLKIDKLFGLLTGADISGTTSDTTFVLEAWGAGLLHSAYYLVPAASIVYNCHHTLVEVALALSLNKVIDYRIGYYTTLLPQGGTPPELNAIGDYLRFAENDQRNRHFLIWYENHSPAGCIHFDRPWEKDLLKMQDLSRATKVLAQAQNLSPFPTRKDVSDLIYLLAPRLVIGLPRALQRQERRVRLT